MTVKDLPNGWVLEKLTNVVEPRGVKVSPTDYPEAKFIGMDHVESNTTKIIGSVLAKKMKSSASRFFKGDVLYGRLRPYLNKVAQPSFDGLASAEFIVFSGNDLMNSKFLLARLNAIDFVNFASHLNEGDRPRVNFNQLGCFEIMVPPPAEQERIVAKIEELFSDLDAGIASLKKAQAQLKIYRQAVLKHAFEGKLTEEWRKKNAHRLEPAHELLQKIKTERQKHFEKQMEEWEKAVEEWEQTGKKEKKPTKPKKPKELPPISKEELMELSELPTGWGWVKLNSISEFISDGDHQPPPKTSNGVPFITISNINKNNQIDFSNTFFVHQDYYNNLVESRRPNKGDILYTVTGSFGIPVLVNFEKCFCFQRHIGLIRPFKLIQQKWIYYNLQSPFVYKQAIKVATGTAQKTVPLSGLRNFIIPFKSIQEQKQIVGEIEARLSVCDQLEQSVNHALKKAESLRQSILKKAFQGKLVPQNPGDEPAHILLQRIKTEKEKLNDKPHKKTKPKTRKKQ